MPVQNNFGVLLKRYRLAACLSQEILASRAHVSPRTVSDLERGIHSVPRGETLELLIDALALTDQQRTLLLAAIHPEISTPTPEKVQLPALHFPIPPTRLVGREQIRHSILELVRHADTRLFTLTGASGVGKTRLALQLLQDIALDFGDGTAFIELASVRDTKLVPGTIAQGLGIRESSSGSLIEQIQLFLQARHFFLVLDNLEQVVDCGLFIADLLSHCPYLFILATSRIPLRLRAEQVIQLPPLPIDEAVTLFCERAKAFQAGYVCERTEVAAICEQLDCLPLAIELVAMHVPLLSLPELQNRLRDRLSLLRKGARDLPQRQQTMEDAIAWSYELLTEEQRRCFCRLSVFVGGWTIEAAEGICQETQNTSPNEYMSIFAILVDANLIQVTILEEGKARCTMLEVIREFALKQLSLSGEMELYRFRHALYFAKMAERVAAHYGTESRIRDVHIAFIQESPNVRAALQWAEEHQEAEIGLRLTGFVRLWHNGGQLSEAEHWLESMLALDKRAREQGKKTAPLTLRIEKLYELGLALLSRGNAKRAKVYAQEALDIALQLSEHESISRAFATLGLIAQTEGKLAEAASAYSESYVHASLAEQSTFKVRALINLAELARLQGEFSHATMLLEDALAYAQMERMQWDISNILTLLGHLACQQQRYAEAKERYQEALALFRAFGSLTFTAWCLEGYAAVLCAEGCFAQTIHLCAATVALREQAQTPLPAAERDTFEHTIAIAQASLDEVSFSNEWKTGMACTHDEAIDYALSDVCA